MGVFRSLRSTRAANEARVAERLLGPRLLGFEIGNKPDDYGKPWVGLRSTSYSASNYLDELATYKASMEATTPGMRVYGPDLASLPSSEAWLSSIASDKGTSFTAIDVHYYPTFYNAPRAVAKVRQCPLLANCSRRKFSNARIRYCGPSSAPANLRIAKLE